MPVAPLPMRILAAPAAVAVPIFPVIVIFPEEVSVRPLTFKFPKAPFVPVPIAPLKTAVPVPLTTVKLLAALAVESTVLEKSIVPLPVVNVTVEASTTTAPLRSIDAASPPSSSVVIFPCNLIVGAVITTSFISVAIAPTVAVPPPLPD